MSCTIDVSSPELAERIACLIASRIVVDGQTGCELWSGARSRAGYGVLSVAGCSGYVHRLMFTILENVPIPKGMQLDHLCRVRLCCNPDHLEVVDQRTNVLRGTSLAAMNAAKVQCLRGHPFDVLNTIVGADGHRRCRECRRLRNAAKRKT